MSPKPKLTPVTGHPREVLVDCARQIRAVRDATPKGRPMYRHLTAQLELLEMAVDRCAE